MAKTNKVTIFLSALILFFVIIFIGQKKVSTEKEPSLPFGQITRADRIKHVDWTYKNGKSYEQFQLEKNGPKNFVVTFFQPNPRDVGLTKQERRGGILVFSISGKEATLVWESEEYVSLTQPTINVRDVNGDGKSEIISTWSDGKTDILYIYTWDGNTFKFITPVRKVEGLIGGSGDLYAPIFGVLGGEIKVEDQDLDGSDEIVIISGFKKDESDNNIPTPDTRTIYKWDGQKYYLWKEEKISP